MNTSYVMLPQTVHGEPSGNYDGSSLFFTGTPVKAANFYQGLGSMQTIVIRTAGFKGVILLQATLETNPELALYFDTQEFGDPLFPMTGVFTFSVRGNFVWMRPEVIDFTAGTIESITITY